MVFDEHCETVVVIPFAASAAIDLAFFAELQSLTCYTHTWL